MMRNFFAQRMGMGRYPDDTRRDLFVFNRRYFDQVLHNNHKFRHEYAEAYRQWAANQGVDRLNRHTLLLPRIETAIELMGDNELTTLFRRLLDALGNEVPLADLHYRDTLPGGRCDIDPACAAFMEPVRRFWLRLALPDVWEEDEL